MLALARHVDLRRLPKAKTRVKKQGDGAKIA